MSDPEATPVDRTDAASSATAPASGRRSSLPRFGLRTALIVAVVFCLLMGWIGRNAYRMRQEDAAIEALKRVQGTILLQGDDFRARHPATPAPPAAAGVWGQGPPVQSKEDWYGRLFGWADRLPIRHVNLQSHDPEDENLDAALDALATFPEIESVNLTGPGFDDTSLPPLSKIAGLEAVGLSETKVTAEGLKALAPARGLRTLHLYNGYEDIADGLSALTQLRTLSIHSQSWTGSGASGSQVGLTGIAALPHLEKLTLMYLEFDGPDFLAPLADATNLRSLEIMGVPLTASDVTAIANLPLLEKLRINGIDDAGLAKLGSLSKLKQIELDSPVSSEAAREFSKSHPACRVEYASYRPTGFVFEAGEAIVTGPSRSR